MTALKRPSAASAIAPHTPACRRKTGSRFARACAPCRLPPEKSKQPCSKQVFHTSTLVAAARPAAPRAFSGLQLTIRQPRGSIQLWQRFVRRRRRMFRNNWFRAILLGLLIAVLGIPPSAWIASAQQQQGPQTPPPPQQPAPPAEPQGKPQQEQKAPPPPQVTITAESRLVNIDANVTDAEGNIITGLKRENFRVLDNNQPQQITNFAPTDAPITVAILMEFSKLFYGFYSYLGREFAYGFLNHLKPQDWVAFKTFDLRTTVQVDFTQDKREIQQSIATLFIPDFTEANLFDAILETVDQMTGVKGRRSIIVIASGYDTFSKHTL